MRILAIDGALGTFSVAVTSDGELIASSQVPPNVALERGLRAVSETIGAAAIEASSLDRIAVGCGPGGFTGIRIAVSYAKSLALGWSLPLVAVSSFDALEAGNELGNVLAAVRGRPGVVSLRLRTGTRERRASGRTADAVREVLALLPDQFTLIGHEPEDVLAALGERGVHPTMMLPALDPAAFAVATVASQKEPARSIHEVRADYGELPAVKMRER